MQQAKDLALLLYLRINPWPWKLPQATSEAPLPPPGWGGGGEWQLAFAIVHGHDAVEGFSHFIYLFIYFSLGPCLQHMEVSRLGVKSKLQLPPYITATATRDPSCICDLHHNSQQHQILNPLEQGQGSNVCPHRY